jgi:polygalacturonase
LAVNSNVNRRGFLAAALSGAGWALRAQTTFDVARYGAVGDGKTLDTAAIQRAIDAAAAAGAGAQVLVRGGKKYLVSTLVLRSNIDFHLADDAELIVSTSQADYPAGSEGVITADGAQALKISGTGNINGQALKFMTAFDKEGDIWKFGPFRPKIFILSACRGLEISGIGFSQAPFWGLHMAGCEHVLVDRLKIRNHLDVPNCDGIDPDHCRDVEIRNCDIVCGDDAIVIKSTREFAGKGDCSNISVKDCVMETKDSGLKIGTETVDPIHDIRFENCEIKSCCRGMTIQLRDEGDVSNISFDNIRFTSHYTAPPWWGRGEAISLTSIPRRKGVKVGAIHDVRFSNITGHAENSARIDGLPESRIQRVSMENVSLTLDRWTQYPGGVYDDRPTAAMADIEKHGTPGIIVRNADNVELKDCSVTWGANCPDYFTYALETEGVTGLKLTNFNGKSAHPARDPAIMRH